ncbi:RICIN domain-containing protein [Actinokineospora soli]|uniref:RICIN domain-containing protein n=1 Tax=Actinokineospora soli TaxID=1048753 RepID=A0ABW2TSL7_9PSEU
MRTALAAVAVGVAAVLSTAGQAHAAPSALGSAADEAYYTWRNQLSGKCLDQNWSGGVNRHTAIAYTCHGDTNQYWQLEWLDTNIYMVRNLGSGECLHQKYDSSGPTTTVQVVACANVGNQRWRVTAWDDGTYSFKNIASGWFLDQSYSGGVERQAVIAYPYHGGANQFWY